MGKDRLAARIRELKGIGPVRGRLLEKIGIKTLRDALYYLPFRYEDRTHIKSISCLNPGTLETVRGKIMSSVIRQYRERTGRRQTRLEVAVDDGTGILRAVWFNQAYRQKSFIVGQELFLSGVVQTESRSKGTPEMGHPEYESITDDRDSLIHTNRIVPIYRTTEGITQKQFRAILHEIASGPGLTVHDPVPEEVLKRTGLPGLAESLQQVHMPRSTTDVSLLNTQGTPYHKRLAFDEFMLFELGMARIREATARAQGISFVAQGRLLKRLRALLPFALTGAQERVITEILGDMKGSSPMRRLLQGDVGSGKTMVALAAILTAVECGYQTVFMAPTEVLAEQHFLTLGRLATTLDLTVELLTGSTRNRRLGKIESGEVDIVIGTHAIIQEKVRFRRLGLAVIDEQHKFGVVQRTLLREKGIHPDVLVMTATPIPRSLAMTLFGDLDCSVLDELPPGRKPVHTMVFDAEEKQEIYRIIGNELSRGRQVYVVYPLIDDSETSDLRSATQGKKAFERIFPEFTVGLLHGKMSPSDKEEVMKRFKNGAVQILVSTTVIEVGIDVPNASVMIIVHAERFGLAQMHQLRGRIGRGTDSSHCLLVAYKPLGDEARRRLDVLVGSADGFRISEEDLAIRGPGEFFGERQAGLPDLRVADMLRDSDMLEVARTETAGLLCGDPGLSAYPMLREALDMFWKEKRELFTTG
ncbi:MAG: ATP-dependent DNA helicase RecG [Nitrospirae bacterium]|nr:MAG: ATP-dependent DNA helicase RecG [Nitrospirota bacterium]